MSSSCEEELSGDDGRISRIIFTEQVQNAIEQVLQKSDPLGSSEFNPIDYINQMFPNEQSLSNIDELISKMECEVSVIDDNIRCVIRGQINTSHDGRVALEDAQKVITQLFAQITEIKSRAEKTEEMVKEITRDIKQLDSAKKNLTTAITALNHLHMLLGGIDSLTKLIENRLYGEILNPLQAISEVNQHFQQYCDIPHIRNLSDQVQKIQRQLADQITEDFHNTFGPHNAIGGVSKMSLSQLTDACKVASVLDPKVKRDLLKWFIALQLEEYMQLFHENQDIAWLDKIDKRYAWLKRHLLDFEEKFCQIFPPEWEVSERVTIQFCLLTRDELTRIMARRRTEIDVKLLLFAITKTHSFEQLLAKRFSGVTLVESASTLEKIQTNSKPVAGAVALVDNPNLEMADVVNRSEPSGFADLIGACFRPHLDIYTESIDRNLSEQIERFVQASKLTFNPLEAKSTIFPSCADLFVFYKKCMVQCTQLTSGKPLYDLAMIFKKYIREYAIKVLEANIPKVATIQSSIGTSMSLLTRDLQNLSTAAGQVIHSFLKEGDTTRFTKDEIVKICCILTSAEYCLDTVQQLEGKLKEKIDMNFVDKIDLSDEKDIFHKIISNCIQILVQDLENCCEPALNVVSKIQWQTINNVGDQSPFVNSIISHFKQTIPIIRDNLATSRKYFTQFCLKFVNSFIPKYINTLFKCRLTLPGPEGSTHNILGCEQLLLDTHSLKTVLFDLPSIASTVNRRAPTSYTKVVVKGMTRAEMIIKVVMAPVQPATNFIEQVLKLLPDIGLIEYQKILDMKGLKRVDQAQFVELFKRNAPSSISGDLTINSQAIDGYLTTTTLTTIVSAGKGHQDSIASSSLFGRRSYGAGRVYDSAESSSDRGRIKRLENLIKKRFPN